MKDLTAAQTSPDSMSDQFPEGSIRLMTRILPAAPGEGVPSLLVEGDAASLNYLARVILAQAGSELDCSFSISPTGAGCAFFAPGAEMGICIHSLPCADGRITPGGA